MHRIETFQVLYTIQDKVNLCSNFYLLLITTQCTLHIEKIDYIDGKTPKSTVLPFAKLGTILSANTYRLRTHLKL